MRARERRYSVRGLAGGPAKTWPGPVTCLPGYTPDWPPRTTPGPMWTWSMVQEPDRPERQVQRSRSTAIRLTAEQSFPRVSSSTTTATARYAEARRISGGGWLRVGVLPRNGPKNREDALNAACMRIATRTAF